MSGESVVKALTFGIMGNKIGDSILGTGAPTPTAAQTAANDTTQKTSTGSKSKAKQFLMSQAPTSGYGSNQINTAKSFLLS